MADSHSVSGSVDGGRRRAAQGTGGRPASGAHLLVRAGAAPLAPGQGARWGDDARGPRKKGRPRQPAKPSIPPRHPLGALSGILRIPCVVPAACRDGAHGVTRKALGYGFR